MAFKIRLSIYLILHHIYSFPDSPNCIESLVIFQKMEYCDILLLKAENISTTYIYIGSKLVIILARENQTSLRPLPVTPQIKPSSGVEIKSQ